MFLILAYFFQRFATWNETDQIFIFICIFRFASWDKEADLIQALKDACQVEVEPDSLGFGTPGRKVFLRIYYLARNKAAPKTVSSLAKIVSYLCFEFFKCFKFFKCKNLTFFRLKHRSLSSIQSSFDVLDATSCKLI